MVRQFITLNNSNYTGGNNYTLRFPKTVSLDKDTKLSLFSFSMYNSFYNISQKQYNNSNITFTWFDGTVYNWIIPDGYYSVGDLNIWLQSQFLINNLYCTNSSNSQNIFFVAFKINSVLYKNEIDTNYVPSSTNASLFGYVKPIGVSWNFPSVNTCITITINLGLQKYFGITDRLNFGPIIPVQNVQYVSNICPTVSSVFSLFITCNLIVSDFTQVANVFCQIPIKEKYGALIDYQSSMDAAINVQPGVYNSITIGLWDQNNYPLQFQDDEIVIMLVIDHQ